MASEVMSARERSASAANVQGTANARNGFRANEKRMQETYKLRHTPERYSSLETARRSLDHYTKMQMIVKAGSKEGFIDGYYVMVPSDANRLYKKGFKIVG